MAPNNTDFDVGDEVVVYGVQGVLTGYASATGRFEVTYGNDPWDVHADSDWVHVDEIGLVRKGVFV